MAIDARDDFRGQMALSQNIGQSLGVAFAGYKKSVAQTKIAEILNRPDFDPMTAMKEVQQIPMYAETEAYKLVQAEALRYQKPVKLDYYDKQGTGYSQMIPTGKYNQTAQDLTNNGYSFAKHTAGSNNLRFAQIPDEKGNLKYVALDPKTGQEIKNYGVMPDKQSSPNTQVVELSDYNEDGDVIGKRKVLIDKKTGESIQDITAEMNKKDIAEMVSQIQSDIEQSGQMANEVSRKAHQIEQTEIAKPKSPEPVKVNPLKGLEDYWTNMNDDEKRTADLLISMGAPLEQIRKALSNGK